MRKTRKLSKRIAIRRAGALAMDMMQKKVMDY